MEGTESGAECLIELDVGRAGGFHGPLFLSCVAAKAVNGKGMTINYDALRLFSLVSFGGVGGVTRRRR
jgi:hypothetical protein